MLPVKYSSEFRKMGLFVLLLSIVCLVTGSERPLKAKLTRGRGGAWYYCSVEGEERDQVGFLEKYGLTFLVLYFFLSQRAAAGHQLPTEMDTKYKTEKTRENNR